jgi:tetratricopeptide (TPR) repeat protein
MLLAVQASSQVAPRERAQALLREGAIHLDGGDAQAAESLLRQASLLDPGNALIWSHLGSALMAQRRFPEAADTFRESLRLDRSSPALGLKLKRQTLDGLGLSLAFQGALREAADLYTAVVAEDPGYPSFSYNLACVLTLDGRTQEAVQALVWALDADARSPAGATLPDPALDDDLKGLRGTPRFQAALLMHLPPQPDDGPSSATMREGAGLLARGRYAEAAAKERSAAALDGADPRCWFFLGGALLETGSTGEACEALLRSLLEDRKASRLPPAAVRFAGLRSGTWLMDQGRHEEAGLALQRAHEAAPNHPWPHYLLARLYATAGRPKEALDSLGRALRHGENLSPGEPLLPDPRTDPSFSALSGDPGWASVVPPAGPQGAAVP